jgi:hypothetical protein
MTNKFAIFQCTKEGTYIPTTETITYKDIFAKSYVEAITSEIDPNIIKNSDPSKGIKLDNGLYEMNFTFDFQYNFTNTYWNTSTVLQTNVNFTNGVQVLAPAQGSFTIVQATAALQTTPSVTCSIRFPKFQISSDTDYVRWTIRPQLVQSGNFTPQPITGMRFINSVLEIIRLGDYETDPIVMNAIHTR